MDPRNYGWKEWMNLGTVAIGMVTTASWWTTLLGPDKATVITGILASLSGLLNFMLRTPTPSTPTTA